MSSGFVSGGTSDAPLERSDEWLAAQQEIEANRRRKAEENRQQGGRSLFETLEANKAAKQEAFEEANRLKNQFRALDADEVEFLDSVLESTRAEEARIKQETAEGLDTFRKLQEEADKKMLASQGGDAISPVQEAEEEWVAGKGKRKRKGREKEGLRGVKIRRSSTTGSRNTTQPSDEGVSGSADKTYSKIMEKSSAGGLKEPDTQSSVSAPEMRLKISAVPPAKAALGLVDYGSGSDDD